MNNNISEKEDFSFPFDEYISKNITTFEDVETTYHSLLRIVMETIGISRGAVLGFNDKTNELSLYTLKGLFDRHKLSQTIILNEEEMADLESRLIQATVSEKKEEPEEEKKEAIKEEEGKENYLLKQIRRIP